MGGNIEGLRIGFQSTPPHGERPLNRFICFPQTLFQSTPPHGERHAAKDANSAKSMFQSTPPHGERPTSQSSFSGIIMFQSTPPHGERLMIGERRKNSPMGFNPRPRTGSDMEQASITQFTEGFNPRPRTGSDLVVYFKNVSKRLFQSTPPHGERHSMWHFLLCLFCVSIHAPARGATNF